MNAALKLPPKDDGRDVYGDFYCGAGGFSQGFALACELLGIKNKRLIAINHSQIAVETHKANHPWAEHYCSRVDQLIPTELVPGGRMKLLIASPECTNHANARGGRPINDQSRATAWDIVKWAQELYIETLLVENVREIMDWGPLGANGRPLKSRKGEIFAAWLEAIRRCGYNVEHRILNAADYGAATTRRRFFLIARRQPKKIRWPEPTHSKDAHLTGDLFRGLKPWRGAYEVIDWSRKGVDIQERAAAGLKPLAENTLARIEAGVRKFWGAYAEPFIVQLRGTQKDQIEGGARKVSEPVPAITGGGIHAGLVEPFVMAIDQGSSNGAPRKVGDPLQTVTTKARLAVVEPFVLQQQSGGAPRSTRHPLPSIAGSGAQAIVQPFLVPFFGERDGQAPRTHDVNAPLPAVTSHGAGALVEPFVVQVAHGTSPTRNNSGRVRSVRQPLGTITRENGHGLVQPLLVKYYRTGTCQPTTKPMPTLTGHDRMGLVTPEIVEIPEGYELRAYFRMLGDDELARAMGFEGYEFKGTKKQRVLAIGNAVSVEQARALCTAILEASR